ncbi:MAG: outer membrane lipoprotein-sorting protein [Puniceicoccales bacterium]|nr:outer membrane lipoprotein-sorting protein [Puniceicoccales bacterium]
MNKYPNRALSTLAIIVLVCASNASMVRRSFIPTLTPKQAELELEKLKKQSLGSYSFVFDLEHRSKDSKKKPETCFISGTETGNNRSMRLDVPGQKYSLLLNLVNSPSPSMVLHYHGRISGVPVILARLGLLVHRLLPPLSPMKLVLPWLGLLCDVDNKVTSPPDSIYDQIIPGFIFTPADMGFSFIFWDKFTYLGPKNVLGLQTQQFKLEPGPGQAVGLANVGYVRISFCTSYGAIIRVEYFDKQDNLLKKMDLLRFKKIDGQWVMTEIDMVDEVTKHRTKLRVKKIAFGCNIGRYLSVNWLDRPIDECENGLKYTDV